MKCASCLSPLDAPPVAHTDTPLPITLVHNVPAPSWRARCWKDTCLYTKRKEVGAVCETGRQQPGEQRRRSGRSALFPVPADLSASETAFHYHLSVHSNELQGSQVWPVKRKVDQLLEYSSSSSSPLESSSSGKAGYNLSLGFSMQDKMAHGGTPFIAGLLLNGNSGGGREKLYRCRYCGKHFAHSGEFTYHLRIHTGEKTLPVQSMPALFSVAVPP